MEDASSSSDSDAEEVDLAKMEEAVNADPNSYQAHEQYISALRKTGNLDKLRAARERMSTLFPLTGKMWQDWASDEARILTKDRSDEISAVEALYERGVNDYLYVPLWVDYLEFVEEYDAGVSQCTPEGLSKMRGLCERAVAAAGLHLAEGMKVWEAYRAFEEAVLEALKPELKEKQLDRVRSLFHRQLAVPLANHASTLQEYKEWEASQGITIGDGSDEFAGIESKVVKAYRKAEKLCDDYKPFEENIRDDKPVDAALLQNYLLYISAEEANGEPPRVQVLFERAISVFPVTAELWLKYCSYLDNLKVASICKSVYSRAVRNCPWVGELWRKYMLALERFSSAEEEIASVFEQALEKGFQTPTEYLDVFLTRADGLRRRMASLNNDFGLLREVFDRGATFLATYFPDFVDRSLQLHAYWAQVEARLFSDLEAARAVWEKLLKTSGSLAEVWQGYIGMELGLGHVDQARALYKRCYSRKFEDNGTEIICNAWLRFEREYGLLKDLDNAVAKGGQRQEEVRAMQLAQEAKLAEKEKVKQVDDTSHEQQNKTPKRKRDRDTKVSKKKQRSEPEKPTSKSDKPDDSLPDGTGGETEGPPKTKTTPGHNEQLTVYVSNLDIQVTAEELEKFFGSCGGLKEVRLMKDRITKLSRGFAYVEFESEDNVAAAVSKNKSKLRGRKISVARSNPKKSAEQGAGKRSRPAGAASEQAAGPKTNEDFRKMFLAK